MEYVKHFRGIRKPHKTLCGHVIMPTRTFGNITAQKSEVTCKACLNKLKKNDAKNEIVITDNKSQEARRTLILNGLRHLGCQNASVSKDGDIDIDEARPEVFNLLKEAGYNFFNKAGKIHIHSHFRLKKSSNLKW